MKLFLLFLIASIQHQGIGFSSPMNTTFNDMDVNSTGLEAMVANHTTVSDYDTIISEEFLRYLNINFAITGIYLPFILSVGIVGNSLTLVLLYRGVLKSSSSIYLIGLSISDLLNLTGSIPWVFTAYPSIVDKTAWKTVYSYYVAYIYPINITQVTTSVWIIVALTVERFIGVAAPLKANQSSTKRPKIVLGAIYLIAICFNIPRFLRHKVANEVDPVTGEEYLVPKITAIEGNPSFKAAIFWLSFVFNIALPLLIIGTLNIAIVVKLETARRRAVRLNSTINKKSRDHQITRLLFAVVVAFIVFNSPAAALIVMTAVEGYHLANLTFRTILLFATTLPITNTVVHFILYAICSSAMRHALMDMLCKIRLVKPQNDSGVSSTVSGTLSKVN